MARITISNNLEQSITPGSIIITDANNEAQYNAPPSTPAMYGRSNAGLIGYLPKSYCYRQSGGLTPITNVNQIIPFFAGGLVNFIAGEPVGNTFVPNRTAIYNVHLMLNVNVVGGASGDSIRIETFINSVLLGTSAMNHAVGYTGGRLVHYTQTLTLIAGDVVDFQIRRLAAPGTISLILPSYLTIQSID